MTLDQLSYSLLGLIRGDLKDNDYLDIRLIQYFIHTQRANWIAKELAKPYPNLDSFVQDLGCVQVETTDSVGYCTIPIGCSIKQTVKDMPKPLYKKGIPLFTRVGSVDVLETPFDFMTLGKAVTFGHGRFNSNRIAAFYDNKKIKLKSTTNPVLGGLEYINIRGIFEDPTAARGFSFPDGTLCYRGDSEYPINAELIDFLHGDIMQYKLKMLLDTPTDKSNDINTDIQSNIKEGR